MKIPTTSTDQLVQIRRLQAEISERERTDKTLILRIVVSATVVAATLMGTGAAVVAFILG